MYRKAPQSCAKSVPLFCVCSQIEFMTRSNQALLPDLIAGGSVHDPGVLWAIPVRGPVVGSENLGGPKAAIGIGWSGAGGGDEPLDRRHASSSPRLLGTHGRASWRENRGQFIPAPAGNTTGGRPRTPHVTERDNRRTRFSRCLNTGLCQSPWHSLPRNVIDPTENTFPPPPVSKYTLSARSSDSSVSSVIVRRPASTSSCPAPPLVW